MTTREAIANFPPEVSEISLLAKLEDKEAAAQLLSKVCSLRVFPVFQANNNSSFFFFGAFLGK